MREVFLVDNSVEQRIHRSPDVAQAMAQLILAGDVASCLPQLLEAGYSARTAQDHHHIVTAGHHAKVFLEPDSAVVALALDLQARLFAAGKGRSVGVCDLQIAATAMAHTNDDRMVTVVHYDANFEHVADMAPEFRHRWIVARGSVD